MTCCQRGGVVTRPHGDDVVTADRCDVVAVGAFGRVVVVRGAARFGPPHAASRTTAGTKTPRATTVRDRRAGSVVELMSGGSPPGGSAARHLPPLPGRRCDSAETRGLAPPYSPASTRC